MSELFEPDYGVNKDPVDSTEITTHILYYSTKELKEFKKLCKAGIKKEVGIDAAHDKGNISDLLLTLLRKQYGDSLQT